MTDKLEFLESFQTALKNNVNGTQKWWTKSLFHFTDISNALSIIESEAIFSREKADRLNVMKNDNANDNVIAITDGIHKKYARLYFGPSTPTQYSNEGIKPNETIINNAHCPIPIMFIFDFIKVFMHENVEFTDGNLANHPNIYKDIKNLEKLNFDLIYHRTWFDPQYRDKIVNARHSEVLIKEELLLKRNLKVLAVRSEAERETFLYQMTEEQRAHYQKKVFIEPKPGIFINDWFYINTVAIIDSTIHIKWHYCSKNLCQNKFTLKIIVKKLSNDKQKSLEREEWYPKNSMKIPLPDNYTNKNLEITIEINNIKAYINSFDES